MNKEFLRQVDTYRKETDKALKRIFGRYIKESFLIKMKYEILKMFPKICEYYNFQMSMENLVSGFNDRMDYDLCRTIVGCHSSNTIFMDNEERIKKEREQDYQKELAYNVIQHVKLRKYGGSYFKNKPLVSGELFINYNVPFDIFVISMRMSEILRENQKESEYNRFYRSVCNKSFAALSLLEDNLLTNCYPICRVIIELYLKLVLFKLYPTLIEEYTLFSEFELYQTCCDQKYPDKFMEYFNNRINKSCKNRIEYLHYGWVDWIEDYHNIVKNQPYSIGGLVIFLSKIYKCEGQVTVFEMLKDFYKMCNGYTHGNVINSKYPLLHYFEISIMLYLTIPHTYSLICEELEIDSKIDSIDILRKIEKDAEILLNQHSERNTDKFKQHYRNFK